MPCRLSSSVALLIEVLTQNCKDDGATHLDNLHFFFKPSIISSPSQSTSHDGGYWRCCKHCWHAWSTGIGLHTTIPAADMKMLSVAYVSVFIARCQLLMASVMLPKTVWYLKHRHQLMS